MTVWFYEIPCRTSVGMTKKITASTCAKASADKYAGTSNHHSVATDLDLIIVLHWGWETAHRCPSNRV